MRPEKKKSWRNALFAYAEGEKGRMAISVVLSVLSVAAGLVPFYCMYALLCCIVDGAVFLRIHCQGLLIDRLCFA